jgi:hypothetical protein
MDNIFSLNFPLERDDTAYNLCQGTFQGVTIESLQFLQNGFVITGTVFNERYLENGIQNGWHVRLTADLDKKAASLVRINGDEKPLSLQEIHFKDGSKWIDMKQKNFSFGGTSVSITRMDYLASSGDGKIIQIVGVLQNAYRGYPEGTMVKVRYDPLSGHGYIEKDIM